MDFLLKKKLEILKDFQLSYPTSHVGGSIGLFLRGVNLYRDLSLSDLDITIDELKDDNDPLTKSTSNSDRMDFNYSITKETNENSFVKIDIRINPEPSFDVVEFEGVSYNVSKYRDILFWKTKYANRGNVKHINDLITIKTGIRPLNLIKKDDDLPF